MHKIDANHINFFTTANDTFSRWTDEAVLEWSFGSGPTWIICAQWSTLATIVLELVGKGYSVLFLEIKQKSCSTSRGFNWDESRQANESIFQIVSGATHRTPTATGSIGWSLSKMNLSNRNKKNEEKNVNLAFISTSQRDSPSDVFMQVTIGNEQVGNLCGRDHSTRLHANRRIKMAPQKNHNL